MIFNAALIALGLIVAVAGLALGKWSRNRIYPTVILGIGVAFLFVGLWLFSGNYARNKQRAEYIYLSMRCLENRDTAGAVYHLGKTNATETCAAAVARSALENYRSNRMIARINRDIARSKAESGPLRRPAEEMLVSHLDAYLKAEETDGEEFVALIQELIQFLGIRSSRQAVLDEYVQSSGLSSDVITRMGLSETEQSRLQISAALQRGNYIEAVREAAALVERDGSDKNRLLLAETVAECAYGGQNVLPDDIFSRPDENGSPSARRERERLEREYETISKEAQVLEDASDLLSSVELEKKLALTERAGRLKKRANHLFVYRGFNAIANIRTVEAGITRARLRFSLQEYDKAVAELLNIKRDVLAMLLDTQAVRERLENLELDSGALFYDSVEFQDALVRLLTTPYPDLRYLSQAPLTTDFTRYLVSAQKTYGQELFLTRVDASEYPAVTVRVSGRKDFLQKIMEGGRGVTVQDSGRTVRYTVRNAQSAGTNISVVVDRSGSMASGSDPGYSSQSATRLENLKAALDEFIHNMADGNRMALVAFSDTAEKLVELTADKGELLSKSNGMEAYGGTNVTQGIRAGTDSLRNAGGEKVMLLMTDGEFSIDYAAVQEAAEAHIVIDTIGFGSANQEALENIAQMTGGQHIQADSSSELSNVYASLQRIIGNTLELTYQVEIPEASEAETPGYVFIKTEGSPGIRAEYAPSNLSERARLDICSPALLDVRLLDGSRDISLTFGGEHLSQVREILVGGRRGTIVSQTDNRLDITVPVASVDGWLDVETLLTDGTGQIFRHLIAAGVPERCPDIRLGCLTISSAQNLPLSGGAFLLGGEQILLAQTGGVPRRFSVWGFMEVPGADNLSSATVRGWGEMTLAESGGDVPSVLTGAWELRCAPENFQLKKLALSGEEAG